MAFVYNQAFTRSTAKALETLRDFNPTFVRETPKHMILKCDIENGQPSCFIVWELQIFIICYSRPAVVDSLWRKVLGYPSFPKF